MKVTTVLCVLSAAMLCAGNASYDGLCDKMMDTAQKAGRFFNAGNTEKGEKAVAKVERLFNEAKEMLPDHPQAYITYATFLLNANRVEKSQAVWQDAKELITGELAAQNPALLKFIDSRINKCKYAAVSMLKDAAYEGGKGDMVETLRLQGEQIALRPLPELYHARGTVKTQMSTTDETLVESAIEDFETSLGQVMKGHFVALELMGARTGRKFNTSSGARRFFDEGEGTTEAYGVPVRVHTAQGLTEDTMPYEVEYAVGRVHGATVNGIDAVVTSVECEVEGKGYGRRAMGKHLAAVYKTLGDETKAKHVEEILKSFEADPMKLKTALKEKYGDQLEAGSLDWLQKWAAVLDLGCDAGLYIPIQGGRVDVQKNIPTADVFGEAPEVDQTGMPSFLTFPRQPAGRKERAVLVAQFAGSSFYHFVVEVLPKIVMAGEAGLKDDKLPVYVPKDTSKNKFIKGFLKLMKGFNMKRVKEYTGELIVDELFVPAWWNDEFVAKTHPPKSLLVKVREALGAAGGVAQDTVVYLSRKGQGMRVLDNDDEIFEGVKRVAEEKGYTAVVYKTPPTVKETRELFQKAAAVVGPHGGALSNTIFCQPGTLVLELGFPSPLSYDFVHLSAALSLTHHLYPLSPTPNGMGAPTVTVPAAPFLATFESLLPPRGEEL